jgi:phosphoglycerate dehydrogenase-like enzyme
MTLSPVPETVVVLGPKADAISALIREALPNLDVRVGGPEPDGPYAVIVFSPDKNFATYQRQRWVHIAGAGANAVLAALRTADITPALITRTVGRMGVQIGEYVLSYVLADAQNHMIRQRLQREQRWDVDAALPTLLCDKKALILGTGAIGSGVADALKALNMDVTGSSRSGRAKPSFDTVIPFDALDHRPDIDIVIGALPLTPDTHHIINRPFLSKFKAALFINVGRGDTADIEGVQAALKSGHLRQAILDVVPTEPLPPDSPLWSAPGITITPHVSGITLVEDTAAAFIAEYQALSRGDPPDLTVDPQAGY